MARRRVGHNELSEDQKRFVDLALLGFPVCITGGAGTGKTFALRALCEEIHRKYAKQHSRVIVVTPTRKSAGVLIEEGIDAATIHHRFGIPVVEGEPPSADGITTDQRRNEMFRNAIYLIIDEIWMVSTSLWVAMDNAARKMRGDLLVQRVHPPDATPEERKNTQPMRARDVPFGGLVVICSGDPLQLKPVSKTRVLDCTIPCVMSDEWKAYMEERSGKEILFRSTVRQAEGDPLLAHLKYIEKHGRLSSEFIDFLHSVRVPDEAVLPTDALIVTPTNAAKDAFNSAIYDRMLAADPDLKKDWPTFYARTIPDCPSITDFYSYQKHMGYLEYFKTPEEVTVLPGSMVMVSKNTISGVDRMTRGRVHSWKQTPEGPQVSIWVERKNETELVTIHTEREDVYSSVGRKIVVASRIGLPLVPAHACTVYACQGITTSGLVVIDLNSTNLTKYKIGTSEIYVAASRARSCSQIRTLGGFGYNYSPMPICPSRMQWVRDLEERVQEGGNKKQKLC